MDMRLAIYCKKQSRMDMHLAIYCFLQYELRTQGPRAPLYWGTILSALRGTFLDGAGHQNGGSLLAPGSLLATATESSKWALPGNRESLLIISY